jgi:hypothetical protein
MRQIWVAKGCQIPTSNSHYCDDKAVRHFREISKICQEEGFELIEDLLLQEAQFSDRSDIV